MFCFQMDSSSFQNPDNIDKDAEEENDQEEEFHTSKSRGKRKVKPRANETTFDQNKPNKILKTRSKVWEHYTRTKENRDLCICHYCKKNLACPTKSGTSNLKNHLKVCLQYNAWSEGQKNTQPIINEEGSLKTTKVSEAIVREASNEMLVLGELPLAFIESMAWRHFSNKVKPTLLVFLLFI